MIEDDSGNVLDDRANHLSIVSPVCSRCQYERIRPRRTCPAFPSGIPEEIWQGKNPHTKIYPGQVGTIIFTEEEDPGDDDDGLLDDILPPDTGGRNRTASSRKKVRVK